MALLFFTLVAQVELPDMRPGVTAAITGITYAVCSASIWSSISIIEHPRVVGVALGIATGAQQFGVGAFLLICGIMLNMLHETRWRAYFALEAGCVGLSWILAGITVYLDWKFHNSRLRKPLYHHADHPDEKAEAVGETTGLIASDDEDVRSTTSFLPPE